MSVHNKIPTSSASALDDKTATVQYKPSTSLAGNNNALVYITNSHVVTIKYHMHYPIFMACMGGAVISLMSYPYTVCTRVSCQAVSPTNGLGTRLQSCVPRCCWTDSFCSSKADAQGAG